MLVLGDLGLELDGAVLGTYKTGRRPLNLAYDGARLWVVNNLANSVIIPITTSRVAPRSLPVVGVLVRAGPHAFEDLRPVRGR